MLLLFISTLLHAYVGARIAPDLPPGLWTVLFITLVVASALLMPMGLLARNVRTQPLSDRLAWAGSLAMGLFSSLFVLTLARDAVLLLAWLVTWPGVAGATAVAVPLLALAITAWGFVNARRTAAVVRPSRPASAAAVLGPFSRMERATRSRVRSS